MDLVDRILELYTKDKKNLREIETILRSEGYEISREAIRRSLKTSKEIAADLQNTIAEARVMIDTVRANPNTDVAEAVVTRLGGLLLRESQNIDALEFEDPSAAVLAAGRLANAQAKLTSVRMKYQDGFEAAQRAVIERLKIELAADPELADRLSTVVMSLRPEAT